MRGWLLLPLGARVVIFVFFRQQDHVQSVPETAHVETSLISPYIQRLTGLWVGLTGTDHPLSIVFSATGVAKEAGGKSGSAGPGFREEANCCLKDDANICEPSFHFRSQEGHSKRYQESDYLTPRHYEQLQLM